MRNLNFHNYKSTVKNEDIKKTHQAQHLDKKIVVDINNLLNRVRIDNKIEKKKKSFFLVQLFQCLFYLEFFYRL
jgi:AAA15 family ATPase/GTPase